MAKTKHHIFTKIEIRIKLIEILGEPKTESDRNYLESEIKFVWNRVPKYSLDENKHRLIHINSTNKSGFVPKKLGLKRQQNKEKFVNVLKDVAENEQ